MFIDNFVLNCLLRGEMAIKIFFKNHIEIYLYYQLRNFQIFYEGPSNWWEMFAGAKTFATNVHSQNDR